MRKNNSGITLVSLVITIIVLLILASITVYSGLGTVRSARLTKFTTELKMMQQKVNELYDSYTNNKAVTVNGTEYVGTDIQKIGQDPEGIFNTNRLEEIFSEDGSGITDRTGYMYYDTETIQALGLEDMEYEFFVNVAKRSVVSIEGFNDYGKRYYTLEQVPDGVYNVEYNKVDGNLSFETTSEVKNGQGKIHIVNISYDQYINKWQVRYRVKAEDGEGENAWTTTEEFTGNEYTIDIPIENLLKNYEIQIIHGNEMESEIKTAHVLQVGDYVNYDPTNGGKITTTYTSPIGTYHVDQAAAIADTSENMIEGNGYGNQTFSVSANTNGWRILGIDEQTNEILLVSTDAVKTTEDQYFYLKGQTAAEWGEKELNDICTIYGKGKGASGARSITVEDINKITGYDPEVANCFAGEFYEYGNEMTYTKNGETVTYVGTKNGNGTFSAAFREFRYYDSVNKIWKSLGQQGSITLKSTAYGYVPNTLTTNPNDPIVGISKSSPQYELLFSDTSNGEEPYWLASSYLATDAGENGVSSNGLRFVSNEMVMVEYLFDAACVENELGLSIRPVISLDADITILQQQGTSDNPHQIQ